MLKKLYSVRDVIAEELGPIFMQKNDKEAMRSFLKMIIENENLVKPEEVELMYLGKLDTETGEITDQPPKVIKNIMETEEDEQSI